MTKTTGELDDLIAAQEDLLGEAAGMVDVRRGNVTKAFGQLVENRIGAIRALEGRKPLATVNLKAGI